MRKRKYPASDCRSRSSVITPNSGRKKPSMAPPENPRRRRYSSMVSSWASEPSSAAHECVRTSAASRPSRSTSPLVKARNRRSAPGLSCICCQSMPSCNTAPRPNGTRSRLRSPMSARKRAVASYAVNIDWKPRSTGTPPTSVLRARPPSMAPRSSTVTDRPAAARRNAAARPARPPPTTTQSCCSVCNSIASPYPPAGRKRRRAVREHGPSKQ